MRTVALSFFDREHARGFTDRRPANRHPMSVITHAALRFRAPNVRSHHDLERAVLLLSGNDLQPAGLDDPASRPGDHVYGVWGALCLRESATPYTQRITAIMVNAEHVAELEADLASIRMEMQTAIGSLTSVFMGYRENEKPPLVTRWPEDDFTVDVGRAMSVILMLHVNYQDERGGHSTWRLLRDARVTQTGVTLEVPGSEGDHAVNGFLALRNLVLS